MTGIFPSTARKVGEKLKKPPYTTDKYLEPLNRQGLIATVSELREYSSLL